MSAGDPARAPTPYGRFVAATRAVLSVPKKEVDKLMRAARERRRRSRRNKHG